MICCRISDFPAQTTIHVVYRNPTSTTSDDFLVLRAIRRATFAQGVCITLTLMPPLWTGQTAHFPNLMNLMETSLLLQRKNSSPSPTPYASRWGTVRQCWNWCSPNSQTQSKHSDYWHQGEIVITHYYPSNLVFMIHTRRHAQELNGVTMSK